MLILGLSEIYTSHISLDNPRIVREKTRIACAKVESEVCANNPRIIRIQGLRITLIACAKVESENACACN